MASTTIHLLSTQSSLSCFSGIKPPLVVLCPIVFPFRDMVLLHDNLIWNWCSPNLLLCYLICFRMSILTLHLTCPVCPLLCHHKLYIRGQFLVLLSDGLQEYFKQSGSGLSGLEVYGEVSGCGDPPECLIEELFPRQPRNLVISSPCYFFCTLYFSVVIYTYFSLSSYVTWRSKLNIEICISWKFVGCILDYRTDIGNAYWIE